MKNQNKALLGGGLILAFLAMNKETKPVDRRKYVNSKIISVEITPALLPPMTNINT